MARVKKDDFVQVISGKDKGRTGKVLRVFPRDAMCIVEKIGLVKRHQKARANGGPSGIVEKPTRLHLCKVMPLDPKTKEPSRVRYLKQKDQKLRQYVSSGEWLDTAKS